jgi:hypothetical protein
VTFEVNPGGGEEAIEAAVGEPLVALLQEAVDVTSQARLENGLDDSRIVPYLRAQLEERGLLDPDEQEVAKLAQQIAAYL